MGSTSQIYQRGILQANMRDPGLCTDTWLPAAGTAAISGRTNALNLGNANLSSDGAPEYVQSELTAASKQLRV